MHQMIDNFKKYFDCNICIKNFIMMIIKLNRNQINHQHSEKYWSRLNKMQNNNNRCHRIQIYYSQQCQFGKGKNQ